jgi:hypothetical protein
MDKYLFYVDQKDSWMCIATQYYQRRQFVAFNLYLTNYGQKKVQKLNFKF